jgi:hypothetical protein
MAQPGLRKFLVWFNIIKIVLGLIGIGKRWLGFVRLD